MHSRFRKAGLIFVVTAFLFTAACGGEGDSEATGEDDSGTESGGGGESEGGGSSEGTVNVSGSSTVEPISVAVAEMFEEVDPEVVVNVDGPGTGDGFELFCNGETDISDASRAITEEEITACEENEVEYIEIKVALDGLSVITNPAFDEIECLTFADIYALVGPESEGFSNWSDAQEIATELGSDTEFPDASLDITAPGEESGTYDSFVEIVIEEFNEDRGQEAQTRPDYSSQADDNAIIAGIEGSESSFGWVGLAFALESGDTVKSFEVDGGDGCVAPTAETVADGSYPIARPLFIYVNAESAESNPAVEAYVDFYVSDEGIASATEVGYVALEDEEFQTSVDAWEAKETGTREESEG
ncbi:substrate-binding domain-containing protein [Iamia sp.]|uniref:substrate-binding domain-containing protein n=1 Tax=Iamia sp. TaxID=2722710 RepID=UPI002C3EB895|nr:substrate-binding domain-containing protein [Iamia sp.]HXH56773.1 substrate-binding domain-containing protein [Iamia sp.]